MIIDTHTLLIIFHIFGVAIGAGAAFMSDVIFLSSVKDRVFTEAEVRILKLMSTMVWIGLGILIISGGFLWATSSYDLLSSSKFLAKMTIVLILTLNGLLFHNMHLPAIALREDKPILESARFVARIPLLVASGALSVVSWMSALVLGVLGSLPFSYFEIMSVYFLAVFVATAIGFAVERDLITVGRKRHNKEEDTKLDR